ncbi:RNA processing protein [Coemansia sp. RSA 988]|nr:RNA processing protein [Coemansia sp. RSA 988]
MLPLSLLNTAVGHPILVELKNGETYNGHLEKCDNFMNIILREVIQTDSDGDRFWRLPEVYIRGNTIKYLRIPDAVLDKVKEDMVNNRGQGSRGGRGGRGRGGRGGDSSSRGRGRGRGRGGGSGDGSHGGGRGGRHVN